MKYNYVDKIDEAIEKKMQADLVQYESSHGVHVNYKPFSIVAHDNGNLVGVLTAYTAFSEIYIDDLWIDSKFRGLGYGKQLVAELEQHFTGQGYNNINLVTSEFSAPGFYKKCGFIEEFKRINKKNPKLTKTFFVKFFNEPNETQGILV